MDLIDADALYTLFVKMKSFGELTAKKAIRCVEEAPTVEAIPIEWMKQKYPAAVNHDSTRYIAKVDLLNEIIEEWSKEE